jgi:zinc transporter 7
VVHYQEAFGWERLEIGCDNYRTMTKMTHPSAIAAAFLSTGFISLLPNVLLFLFPNFAANSSSESQVILSIGQSLAVGGLLGDVFLHTLPDCFAGAAASDHLHHHMEDHGHDHKDHHHHSHEGGIVGLIVIAGFATFLLLDICVRSLEEKYGGGCHGHSHNHKHNDSKKEKIAKQSAKLFLSSSVLLNLLGDSLHNFTDGLAIGATFAASEIHSHDASAFSLLKSRGGLATASVFFHEIPHELGDFATLLNAGFSRNMAIGAQFMTAIAAFVGTTFGLYSSQLIEGLGHEVLLPFTAGGFLYLACCTILPEILATPCGIKVRFMQFFSFAVGVAFLYAAGQLEEDGHSHGFHQHHHDEEL